MNAEIKRGSLEMTAAMLISGSIGWFVLMSGQPVVNVVFWRCAVGAPVLLAVCGALGQLRRDALTRVTLLLAIAGGVALVINWLLLFAAYSYASISIATAVYNTQPFMLVGLGALFLGTADRPQAVVAGVGVRRHDAGGAGAAAASRGQSHYLAGIALALGAAFFYALMALAAKRLKGTPPHLIALIQVAVGAVMLLPLVDFHVSASVGQWGMLATLGVLHTGLMYVLMYGALQKLPTNLIGSLSFIYPVAAMLVDRLAFGHRLSAWQLLGAAIILLAAAGMNLLGERRARLLPASDGRRAG